MDKNIGVDLAQLQTLTKFQKRPTSVIKNPVPPIATPKMRNKQIVVLHSILPRTLQASPKPAAWSVLSERRSDLRLMLVNIASASSLAQIKRAMMIN